MARIVPKEEFLPRMKERFKYFENKIPVCQLYADVSMQLDDGEAIIFSEFEEEYDKLNREKYELNGKTVFISLPITGNENEARESVMNVKDFLRKHYPDCTAFSSFDVAPMENMPTSYYMGRDVEQLIESDVILQMPGYLGSKGCKVENYVADVYQIQKIFWNDLVRASKED